MATLDRPTAINVEARKLDVSIIPQNFSIPYTDFVVSQNDDLISVASQANNAAEGAYQAQLTNEQQDELLADHTATLEDHERRISSTEEIVENHELRISAAEVTLVDHGSRISTLETASSDYETRISDIEVDYVSKSAVASQTLASPINVATSYSVNGTKVVGPRQTGWTVAGGTIAVNTGTWNPNTLTAASATYVQAENTALRAFCNEMAARVKALEAMARYHGLIN